MSLEPTEPPLSFAPEAPVASPVPLFPYGPLFMPAAVNRPVSAEFGVDTVSGESTEEMTSMSLR